MIFAHMKIIYRMEIFFFTGRCPNPEGRMEILLFMLNVFTQNLMIFYFNKFQMTSINATTCSVPT